MVEFVLQYGQEGLDALAGADEQVLEAVEEMIAAGLLERDGAGGLRLTPRMVRGMEHRALLEIFRDMRAGRRESHVSTQAGRVGERADGTRGYEFGDPLSEVALHETVRNAVARLAGEGSLGPDRGVAITPGDIEVHNAEASGECATVVLLDLSGSMMRYGRHVSAKRVAMGLRSLVRGRFPGDTVDFVGFASVAEPIAEGELALIMPRPVTTRAWQVRVRVPLDQAGSTHPHFTNLQHGLRVARSVLARRGAANKQVFIITDGEPTAHLSASKEGVGPTLNLVYPPEEASADAALKEALACVQAGIRISTFALIEEYHAMDWVGFVERLTRLTRGVAYYCTAGDLSATLMESYLTGKKTRRALG
jgi:uncharacterized protein with von Willebrand factor type A (vWA) domain